MVPMDTLACISTFLDTQWGLQTVGMPDIVRQGLLLAAYIQGISTGRSGVVSTWNSLVSIWFYSPFRLSFFQGAERKEVFCLAPPPAAAILGLALPATAATLGRHSPPPLKVPKQPTAQKRLGNLALAPIKKSLFNESFSLIIAN